MLQPDDTLGEAGVDVKGLLTSSLCEKTKYLSQLGATQENTDHSSNGSEGVSERGVAYRVDPNDGVLRRHRLPPHKPPVPPRGLRLGMPRVLRLEALEQRLDRLREALVRRGLRDPGRVAAGGRHGEQGKESDTRGLALVGDVGVEGRRREVALAALPAIGVVRAEVDVEDLDVVLDVRADGLLQLRSVFPAYSLAKCGL